MARKHQTTYLPPPRPAREIAITARRIGRQSPANYDSAEPSLCTAGIVAQSPQGDVPDSRVGRPT